MAAQVLQDRSDMDDIEKTFSRYELSLELDEECTRNAESNLVQSTVELNAYCYEILTQVNKEWLSVYASHNKKIKISDRYWSKNSIWMNDYFQKQRVLLDPLSKQGINYTSYLSDAEQLREIIKIRINC